MILTCHSFSFLALGPVLPVLFVEGGKNRIGNRPREFKMVGTSVSLASVPNMPLIFNIFFFVLLTIECACMLNRFSCVQFFATLWTLAPPPHGILQTRTLEWVAVLPPGDLPDPGIQPASPALAGRFFTTSAIWEAHC